MRIRFPSTLCQQEPYWAKMPWKEMAPLLGVTLLCEKLLTMA